jgi:FMN-binding protein
LPKLPAWVLIAFLTCSTHAIALERIYQEPDVFISEALGSRPQAKVLWLTKEMQAEVTRILGHPPTQLRQRYWSDGVKRVWILEEIGKEEPITAGFVIANGRVEHVRVLVYRERRGSEVRYPSFLKQFENATLTPDDRLSPSIDGISGATLSVSALERLTRMALHLDRLSRQQ